MYFSFIHSVLNPNQINGFERFAKRANGTRSIYAADIEDLQKCLDEIWELFRQSLVQLAAPLM